MSEPKYVLTYVIDGVVYKTIEKTIGETIATESVPVKEGYTFSGWSKAPDVMPAEDVTIYGSFAVNKYLVTFKIGDEVIASDSLEYGVTIVAPEAPEKEGYTFNAWENMPQTVPANDVVIKGLYTANEYLLAFVIDGALYEMHKVKCDEKIEAFETEEREGYTFIWENWIDKMPAKDYTIRGKYVPNKYGITYIVDGETIQNDSVEYGTVIVLPGEPIKEGYTFSGWSEAPETMPAEDVTISGFFTVNKYLVTFVIDDEVIASDSLEYGASIVAPIAPEKEGHTFNGWGEVAETVPAEDVTYYGSYSVNSYLLTYVVDGETVQSDSVAYGSTIVALEEPTKEGHTFSGWSEIPETMPAEDVTISGFFTVNKYLVTFVIDDEVIASDSLEYGASIVAPIAPEKEGHTFNGWGEVAETVPAEDITYYGSYSVNSYLLSYVVDGETVQSDSVAYGSTIVALEEPTKEGHTFSGWGEVPETMPAEDVVISGFFTVNTYKVYYYVGDELVHTAEVAYGEAIPEYAYEPTAEGDVFVGWVGETYETMPAHDVTYTANIESGIEEIENSKLGIESSVIYDLHGRKIQVDDLRELERGVYIIDNKKVVIK
ncbi:MAG: InlB B-repeat-containing protein [Bacteroidaceae bacterium]|nr:InlB B-repeat-containing protein [Bacteroidaceae bacterium]